MPTQPKKDRAAGTDPLPVPLVAEALGTALLVFFGVGVAVLAAEYVGSLGIAAAFGLVLLVLTWILGAVSGCHVNPAVTLGVLVARRIDVTTAVRYWVAQLVGAIVGAALLFLVTEQVPGLVTSGGFGTNGFGVRSAVRINTFGALLAEVFMTFLLVFVFLAVTRGESRARRVALPVGLTLAAVHLVGIPLTGTSVNPARSIGPALFAGGAALTQLWLFVVAPLAGAALAALAHTFLTGRAEAGSVPAGWAPPGRTGAGAGAAPSAAARSEAARSEGERAPGNQGGADGLGR